MTHMTKYIPGNIIRTTFVQIQAARHKKYAFPITELPSASQK